MFRNGGLVTLVIDKVHGEGDDAVKLRSGICGMVSQGVPKKDGNHQYTVDFGAYGAWYCFQNELSGDDAEGWEPERTTNNPWEALGLVIPTEADRAEERRMQAENNNEDDEEEEDDDTGGAYSGPGSDEDSEEITPIIDVEADIKRRMQELEKGY